eukprot:5106332-Alexandrium_andersonii.AAC.1
MAGAMLPRAQLGDGLRHSGLGNNSLGTSGTSDCSLAMSVGPCALRRGGGLPSIRERRGTL